MAADGSQTKEPADLVRAKEIFEAKIKAVTNPITAAYIVKLEAMKKVYGAKGDLESALAVQKEIDRLATASAEMALVGKWAWRGEKVVEFFGDGLLKSSDGFTGTWKCLDAKARTYQASWNSGSVDTMALSSDGLELAIGNSKSGKGSARRSQ
jgi:hypothetical protein